MYLSSSLSPHLTLIPSKNLGLYANTQAVPSYLPPSHLVYLLFFFNPPHKLLTPAEIGCSGGLEVTPARGTRGARSMVASSREPPWKPHMAAG